VADSGSDHPLRVVRAELGQRDALAELMAAAFDQDPVSIWLFPDEQSRESTQRRFFTLFLDLAFESGEVYTTDTGHGVALCCRSILQKNLAVTRRRYSMNECAGHSACTPSGSPF
jgi:hypothetical protein